MARIPHAVKSNLNAMVPPQFSPPVRGSTVAYADRSHLHHCRTQNPDGRSAETGSL